jgi:methionine sulfoxide reductase catalytic subunit
MFINNRRGWEISESLVTPETLFFNRRKVLAGLAAVPFMGSAQAAVNAKFADAGRAVTPEAQNTTYNNFYEYGTSKSISDAAQALIASPWSVQIDGLVEAPMTLAFEDLMKKMSIEDRIYRHRCVEAWAMVVPWTGFALKELVALAKPKAEAKYVRFETFNDPKMAPGQEPGLFDAYPWPYVEGLSMAEATNDLAFIATGAYGKDLPKSMGAPLRLHTPWKYGFKSIKSIVKISFVAEQPVSFWQQLAASEYGFWANVNPDVPHPRWSQATEEVLGTGERMPTKLFNGYGEFVAELYKGMEKEKIYF